MISSLPPHFETARLSVRLPQPTDTEIIFEAYCQDPEVSRYMIWMPHESVDTTRDFINSCLVNVNKGFSMPYLLTLKPGGQPIGMLDARLSAFSANIGYVLAREHWGQGLMPEALLAFVNIALSGPFFRVEATCDVENHASVRALEKSGFAREGRLARYTVLPNLSPEPRDAWLYAVHR